MTTRPTSAEQRLLEALRRISDGAALRCDGKLTRSNLAREAGVSRATLYRHPGVLEKFDDASLNTSPTNERIRDLELQLKEAHHSIRRSNLEVRKLESRLRSAVTVMLELQALVDRSHEGSKITWLKR